MNYAKLHYITEQALVKLLPPNVKCVDYIIKGKESNIFNDAKAVEMPYLGKVSDNPEVIQGKVKNSAIKAIEQAYELYGFLYSSDNLKLPVFRERSYLLVVTYKELYLGSGQVLYESVAQKKINNITSLLQNSRLSSAEDTNKTHSYLYFIE